MKSTIRDVAKLANVSISTVSRVLNTPEMVTPNKRIKVLEAIEQLQFHPNALARGLIHKRTETLGVLIPDVSNFFFAEVFRGMEDAAHESGNNLIICNTDSNKNRMISYLGILNEKQIDGIVFTSEPVYPDYYEIFSRLNVPIVLAATHSLEFDIPSVKVNDEQAGYDATEYLIQQGHKKIAMISGPSTDPIAGLPRLQGFMRAMRTNALQMDLNRCVEYGSYRHDDGYEAMKRLIDKFPEVTSVFAASDEMALGAITYLYQKGIRVPDQVSIIGFDNTRIANMCLPKLTTVAQPLHNIGYQAVKKLEELLNKGSGEELRTCVPHHIVQRESVRNLL
jgi:LacI family transcriptional regulator